MESNHKVDVAMLNDPQRRALEAVIGCHLSGNEKLTISVDQVAPLVDTPLRPAQSLDDWARVYQGLSEADIASIDMLAKTRAAFARDADT